jgi:hypothetical protein
VGITCFRDKLVCESGLYFLVRASIHLATSEHTLDWVWGYCVSQMPQKLNPGASALEGTCSVQQILFQLEENHSEAWKHSSKASCLLRCFLDILK